MTAPAAAGSLHQPQDSTQVALAGALSLDAEDTGGTPTIPLAPIALSSDLSEEVETSSVQVTCCPVEVVRQYQPPCQTLQSKFCRLVRAAEDADSGIDPTLVAAIGIHESGFSGAFGFGIVGGRGYRTANDPAAAVGEFLELVSGVHYRAAWAVRGSNEAFLNGLVDANYAGSEGRGWPPKVLWLRTWMIQNPNWRSD